MKKILTLIVALLALAACKQEGPDPAEVAGQAARTYYEYLVKGNCEAYVDGFYQPDSLPASYRSQLIDAARMLVAQQQDERQGMKAVAVASAQADTVKRAAQVLLTMTYGDGSEEQIAVPLVYVNHLWYLR